MDHYELLSRIKEGKNVWLARSRLDGSLYVLKHVRDYDIEVYRRLQILSPPGLPKIVCLEENADVLTIVEEYIHGFTAEALLKANGPFPPEEACFIILEICRILDGLHSSIPPMIHRDIKPSNIMIGQNREIWLLDFNAVREIKPDTQQDTRLLGTPEFAAPEQYGFGQSDIRTDIYGLGITLNVLLTGRLPMKMPAPEAFARIISRCTRLDPADRYANINELCADLRQALAVTDLTSHPEAPYSQASVEFNTDTQSQHQRAYLPVGFRSGKWWHILAAIPTYGFIFYMLYAMNWRNDDGSLKPLLDQVMFRMAVFFFFFFPICWFGNYLRIRDYFPGCQGKGFRPVFFILLWGILLDCMIFIAFAVITAFITVA